MPDNAYALTLKITESVEIVCNKVKWRKRIRTILERNINLAAKAFSKWFVR